MPVFGPKPKQSKNIYILWRECSIPLSTHIFWWFWTHPILGNFQPPPPSLVATWFENVLLIYCQIIDILLLYDTTLVYFIFTGFEAAWSKKNGARRCYSCWPARFNLCRKLVPRLLELLFYARELAARLLVLACTLLVYTYTVVSVAVTVTGWRSKRLRRRWSSIVEGSMGFKSTTKATTTTTTTDCSQTFACWSLALTQVLKQLSPARSAMIILAVQYEKHAEILRHYFEISAETTSLLTFLEEKYSASVADTIARGGKNPIRSTTTTAASAARSQTCGQLTTDNNDLTTVLEEDELYFDEVSLRLWKNLQIQDDVATSIVDDQWLKKCVVVYYYKIGVQRRLRDLESTYLGKDFILCYMRPFGFALGHYVWFSWFHWHFEILNRKTGY